MLFLNLQSLEQNLSLDINPICTVVLYYPRDSIVDSYLCDECKKSNEPSVCHKLLSILWLFWQVCLRTKECQVYQFVLNTSFKRIWETYSGQFSNRFQLLLLEVVIIQARSWNFVQLLRLFCLPVHNISRRTFEHVLPCRKTMRPSLREVSPTLLAFQLL